MNLYLLYSFQEKYNYFLQYLGSFYRKTPWGRGRIKFNKYYFIHTIPGQLPVKKIFVQIFSSFAAVYHKGHFRKILTQIFKLSWFSWYDCYTFQQVEL